MSRLWPTPSALEKLTYDLVCWNSITGTTGESEFPYRLKEQFERIPYFKENPDRLKLHSAQTGRQSLSAIYRCNEPSVTDTVILISHFDTVNTDDYGEMEPLALDPLALTNKFKDEAHREHGELKKDILSDEYVFGRGIMDMKSGLAQHMQLIEEAIHEEWSINLILVAVHDEESDSEGIRTVIPALNNYKTEYDLNFRLFLNGEPSFPMFESDVSQYIYTGSMGKLMPTVVVRGKGTHAGDSQRSVSAPYILSFITQEMEWNKEFTDTYQDEMSSLPATLSSRDLKTHYSVQIPVTGASMYNVLMLQTSADELMQRFMDTVENAVTHCSNALFDQKNVQLSDSDKKIRVMSFEELDHYVGQKHSHEWINAKINEISNHAKWDEREQSIRITEMLLNICPEVGPAAVCLFAPPYYPAVNSSEDPLIIKLIEKLLDRSTAFDRNLIHRHYFNGISDLSYVNEASDSNAEMIAKNMPVWGKGYTIPFDAMTQLHAPVMNIGSFGKDPHLRSERLHKQSAFLDTPELIRTVIQQIINE